jgi:hypothetical protein
MVIQPAPRTSSFRGARLDSNRVVQRTAVLVNLLPRNFRPMLGGKRRKGMFLKVGDWFFAIVLSRGSNAL